MVEKFVDLSVSCPEILLDIRYATKNNFTNEVLYPSAICYLRRSVAHKLVIVQRNLEKQGLGLKVFDGYRPLSVQKKFWEIMPDSTYIARPELGSKHNRGAAVDLTIVDQSGKELLMPTSFDSFNKAAHRDYFDLPKEVIRNRDLLESVMINEGFIPLPKEWWHFDDANWSSFPVLDVSFEEIGRDLSD